MTIEGLELVQTCECCPEQYNVLYNGIWIGYIRYRSGHFTCQPVFDGQLIINYLVIHETDDWSLTLKDDNREEWLIESKQELVKFWNDIKAKL